MRTFAHTSSPLKKLPGEGTGPTTHADSRGNIVGRVSSRGEQDVFERAVKCDRFFGVRWFDTALDFNAC